MVLLPPKPDNVATYDYYDTAEGKAVKRYYLMNISGANLSEGTLMLTDWASYSTFPSLQVSSSSIMNNTRVQQRDFDLYMGRSMRVIGEVRIGCTTGILNDTVQQSKNTWLNVVLYQSGSAMTQMCSGTTLTHYYDNMPLKVSSSMIHALRMPCPLTKLKKGEYIKVRVNQLATADSGGTFSFGCDPTGRKDELYFYPGGKGRYGCVPIIKDHSTTFTIDIPFKVED